MARKGPFALALERALRATELTDSDQAMVSLARKYAAELDEHDGTLLTYGRVYRETLAELGMSPKARHALAGGVSSKEQEKSPIDELRARRKQRGAQ